jgi:hypothetical protein
LFGGLAWGEKLISWYVDKNFLRTYQLIYLLTFQPTTYNAFSIT